MIVSSASAAWIVLGWWRREAALLFSGENPSPMQSRRDCAPKRKRKPLAAKGIADDADGGALTAQGGLPALRQ